MFAILKTTCDSIRHVPRSSVSILRRLNGVSKPAALVVLRRRASAQDFISPSRFTHIHYVDILRRGRRQVVPDEQVVFRSTSRHLNNYNEPTDCVSCKRFRQGERGEAPNGTAGSSGQ